VPGITVSSDSEILEMSVEKGFSGVKKEFSKVSGTSVKDPEPRLLDLDPEK
jgi:hypothetical protein